MVAQQASPAKTNPKTAMLKPPASVCAPKWLRQTRRRAGACRQGYTTGSGARRSGRMVMRGPPASRGAIKRLCNARKRSAERQNGYAKGWFFRENARTVPRQGHPAPRVAKWFHAGHPRLAGYENDCARHGFIPVNVRWVALRIHPALGLQFELRSARIQAVQQRRSAGRCRMGPLYDTGESSHGKFTHVFEARLRVSG